MVKNLLVMAFQTRWCRGRNASQMPRTDGRYSEMHTKMWSLFADQLGSDLLFQRFGNCAKRKPLQTDLSLCHVCPVRGMKAQQGTAGRQGNLHHLIPWAFGASSSWHHVGAKYRRLLTRLRSCSTSQRRICARSAGCTSLGWQPRYGWLAHERMARGRG